MPNLLSLPDLSLWAVPLYISLIALEMGLVRSSRARGGYETRDTLTSLSMGVGSVVAGALLGGIGYGLLLLVHQERLATLPVTAGSVLLCFVLNDFVYYWSHRIGHESRWFWASHVVHHSSQRYNLSTALRQSWTGHLTGLVLLKVPLVLMGFHPALIAFVASANLVYQFWIHTEAVRTLPRGFEAIFNSPSHHRVHHASNPRYLDANYGGTFIVWDRLFGTFVPEQESCPVRFGLVKNLDTFNPLRVAFHEYQAIGRDALGRALSPRQRLAYVFARPGWSHDGSRKDSAALKAEAARHSETVAPRPAVSGTFAPSAVGSSGLPPAAGWEGRPCLGACPSSAPLS